MAKRLLAMFAVLAASGSAQWLDYPSPGTPRTPDGKANLSAPAPRAADGKPDLSGVWRVAPTPLAEMKRLFGKLVDAAESVSVPGMEIDDANKYVINVLADFKPEDAPLRPEAARIFGERAKGDVSNPVCMPLGPVTQLLPDPHKIVQAPRQMVIMYEGDGTHRQVYTDGRGLPKEIEQPAWQGYSTGRWEGDTLVVETAGFNDRTWLDIVGHPHSEALHITERYHRVDFGHMQVEVAYDDPQMYTKPFTIRYAEELLPDTDILEFVCNENEKDVAHVAQK